MPDSEAKEDLRCLVQMESTDHYENLEYLFPQRMASFGYQLKLVCELVEPGAEVLEVGPGPGVVTSLLRRAGRRVRTLDVDDRLNPDVVATITDIPLHDREVDAFLCCQVLEHLPWEQLPACLRELGRIAGRGVLSVPTNRPTYVLIRHNHRSRMGHRRLYLGSRRNKPIKGSDVGHYWELDSNRTTQEFRSELNRAGFRILSEVHPIENLYHHFFVLERY